MMNGGLQKNACHVVHVRLVLRAVTTRSFEGVVVEAAWLERPRRHFCYRQASGLHDSDQNCQMGDVMRTGCSILGYYPLEPIAVFVQGSGGQGTTLKERVGQRGSFRLSLTILLALRRVAYDGRWPSAHSIALVSG
jgi:hypothetical protein